MMYNWLMNCVLFGHECRELGDVTAGEVLRPLLERRVTRLELRC
jgi:hypothetical protein